MEVGVLDELIELVFRLFVVEWSLLVSLPVEVFSLLVGLLLPRMNGQ